MTDDRLFGLAKAIPLVGWITLLLAPLARAKLVAAARDVAVVLVASLRRWRQAATRCRTLLDLVVCRNDSGFVSAGL